MKRSVSLLMLSLVLFSCNPLRHFGPEKLLIVMKKTACMGECPVYTMKISQSGDILLFAEEHLPYRGTFLGSLGKEKLSALRERIAAAELYEKDDRYTSNFTDLPTTYLTYYGTGRTPKKIMDYDGAPEDLKKLEMYLHQYIYDIEWKETDTPAGEDR